MCGGSLAPKLRNKCKRTSMVSKLRRVKGYLRGTIATAIFLLQQMGCMGFNVSDKGLYSAIAKIKLNPIQPISCKN